MVKTRTLKGQHFLEHLYDNSEIAIGEKILYELVTLCTELPKKMRFSRE
jgi:hypothetical protein